jgi:hypothetical protein
MLNEVKFGDCLVWYNKKTGKKTVGRFVNNGDHKILRIIGDEENPYELTRILYADKLNHFSYIDKFRIDNFKLYPIDKKVFGSPHDALSIIYADLLIEDFNTKEMNENINALIKLVHRKIDTAFKFKRVFKYQNAAKDLDGLKELLDDILYKANLSPKEAGGMLNLLINIIVDRIDDMLTYRKFNNEYL